MTIPNFSPHTTVIEWTGENLTVCARAETNHLRVLSRPTSDVLSPDRRT